MNIENLIDAISRNHIAVLGKTGSGKTSTEKLIVERMVQQGVRVCVLDTIKSDWWGITSSASGKRAGLPFKILGGPRGHVPLHASAGKVIGQLVGTGKLPLSIIDMADFPAGGIQQFFVDFAESLWRNARGVVVLVIEEAHEIAPKELAGFGKETMAIHWAKKLGTGSRTKGIRLIVGTQRAQALHNAVLGSCETLIAHRMTLDADIEQVRKWLKSSRKDMLAAVNESVARLPTGTGWLCSGEADIFQKVEFPKFHTYDNTATPESDEAAIDVKTAPVDQEELKSLIGDAARLAEQTDVASLQKRIRQLEAEAAATAARPGLDPAQLEALETRGFERGKAAMVDEAKRIGQGTILSALRDLRKLTNAVAGSIENSVINLRAVTDAIDAGIKTAGIAFPDVRDMVRPTFDKPSAKIVMTPRAPRPSAPKSTGEAGSVSGPEQKIIDAIRWWNVMGVQHPTAPQVGFKSGYAAGSGTWARYLSTLRKSGLIEDKGLVLTEAGMSAAQEPQAPGTIEELHALVIEQLDTPLQRILKPILVAYPQELTHQQAAEESGYVAGSGTWARYLSSLRSKELIEKRGLRAQGWMFP